MRNRLFLTVVMASALTACGGGGGGGGTTPEPPPPVTFLSTVPGADMTWSTATDSTLSVTVKKADGSPASGAAVRVFTVSHTGPDGSPLASPEGVAQSQIDTALTDASGALSLPIRLSATLSELMIVATMSDSKAQGVVSLASPSLSLTLASPPN
jgi:hypothetical protein